MSLLSVIIPSYNEKESVEHIITALKNVLDEEKIDFEIIFIDDGSTDSTFEIIKEQAKQKKNISGYRLSRNYGKESAIWAGLQKIRGDCCVVIDCDLQHPPETIPKMFRLWEEGYEIVEGVKSNRGKESVFSKLFTKLFYKIISSMSGLDMKTSSDFKLLDKQVVDELMLFNERNTFFRGLSFWVGFRSTKVEYDVAPRKYGKTKWSTNSLTKYAIDCIINFSAKPLQLVTGLGFILIIASLVMVIQTIVRYSLGYSLEGFTTIILLLLLIGGGLMISLGIIGLYIAKIYDEVKRRPRFIISESIENSDIS